MKYRRSALLVGLFILVSIQSGCKNSGTPVTPQSGSGSLTGTVKAYAPNGSHTIDPTGIVVSIQGTSLSATANAQGSFNIDNIPAGVYNIIFSKPGFDSMIYPVHHMLGVGTDVINDAFLIKAPGDSMSFDHVSVQSTDSTGNDSINARTAYISVSAHLVGGDTAAGAYLFLSNDSVFANTSDFSSVLGSNNPGPYSVKIYFDQDLPSLSVKSGSVVYIWTQTYSVPGSYVPRVLGEYASYSTHVVGNLTRYRFVVP